MSSLTIRIGLLSGLIAVVITTLTNVVGRLIGLFPDPIDLKYMAEFMIDPAKAPALAFIAGVIVHIVAGTLIGALYLFLIKRPTILNGLLFTAVVWLGMMLVLFPVTGRGFFGLNIGPIMIVATLILSIIYGVILGWCAHRLSEAPPAFRIGGLS